MALLTLSGVRKCYGADVIIDDANLVVHDGDRVGVVGPNGTGKTTLLKLILGEEELDRGEIHRANGLTLGYLPQLPDLPPGRTVLECALDALSDLRATESRLRELEERMGSETDPDALQRAIDAHGHLHEQFERAGGYNIEGRAEAVLTGLGLGVDRHGQDVSTLSGGEKCRVALTRLLLRSPDLLLLDEPTNHLDVDGAEWLEEYLRTRAQAFLVISHDRFFLDRVTTRTLSLGIGGEKVYPGGYTRYRDLHAEEVKARIAEVGKQQDFIKKEKAFIRKHMGSQRTREAKGRRRRLERMEFLDLPARERNDLRLDLSPARRAGNLPLATSELSVGHDGRALVAGLTMNLEPGRRLGIVGRNGCGKTTLLRALAGRTLPMQGSVTFGANVDVGYFDQEMSVLVASETVYGTIHNAQVQWTDLQVRSFLARLVFYEDDVERPVSKLSGGEKARLCLGLLLLARPNVLFLDEPTNHLDIPSRQALENLLAEYRGTIVTVSHDRWFLDRVVDTILWIDEAGARLYPTDYSGAARTRRDAETAARKDAEKKPAPKPAPTARPAAKAPRRRPLARVEEEIIAVEEEKEAINSDLAEPAVYADGGRVRELTARLAVLDARLAELEAEWDALTT